MKSTQKLEKACSSALGSNVEWYYSILNLILFLFLLWVYSFKLFILQLFNCFCFRFYPTKIDLKTILSFYVSILYLLFLITLAREILTDASFFPFHISFFILNGLVSKLL